MHEDGPQGTAKKTRNKTSRNKRSKNVPASSKPSTSTTQAQVQMQSYMNYTTPLRPTPPRSTGRPRTNAKGYGQNDWSPTSRAKADAVLANTSSHWYAGAAFDRSPAAHTLPHPTKLLATREAPKETPLRPEEEGPSARFMATSCPSSSGVVLPATNGGSKTCVASPEQKSQVDLRAKSQDLLRLLKGNKDGTKEVGKAKSSTPPPPTHGASSPAHGEGRVKNEANVRDVEELTRQVRQLLNLPSSGGRQIT